MNDLKTSIKQNTKWRNRKTGKLVIIHNQPEFVFDVLELFHASGKITRKQQHEFLRDHEKL